MVSTEHVSANPVRQALVAQGLKLVSTRQEARLILEIMNENIERKVLSVGEAGKVEEFSYHYRVDYRATRTEATGDPSPVLSIKLSRDLRYQDSAVLATSEEQSTLANEMRDRAMGMIVERLGFEQEAAQ